MAENLYEKQVSSASHLALPGIPNADSVLNICVRGEEFLCEETRGVSSLQ